MRYLLPLVLIFASCASVIETRKDYNDSIIYIDELDLNSNPSTSLIDSTPSNGHPVFLGVSPSLSNEDKETAAALVNAAEQAVKYYYVKGLAGYFTAEIGSQGVDSDTFKAEWEKSRVEELINELEIIRIVKDRNGTYVLAELKNGSVGYSNFNSGYDLKEGPDWLFNAPLISGYFVGVGGTKISRLISDSIKKADDMALASLISSISTSIYAGHTILEDTSESNYDRILSISKAEIYGFNVISRWMSNDGKYIYSLAVCRDGKPFE